MDGFTGLFIISHTHIKKNNHTLFTPGRGRITKRQTTLITPADVAVLDTPVVVDGVLMVEFVVGGHGGQSPPISGTEMAALLQRDEYRQQLARDMSVAVCASKIIIIIANSYC